MDDFRHIMPKRLAAGGAAALLVFLSACSPGDEDYAVDFADSAPATATVSESDVAALSIDLSGALFAASDVAVVVDEGSAEEYASLSAAARVPLLVGTGEETESELERLGVRAIVSEPGADLGGLAEGRELVEAAGGDEAEPADTDALADLGIDEQPAPATVMTGSDEGPAAAVARALAEAAGASHVELAAHDPRADADSVSAAKEAVGDGGDASAGVIAVGDGFGSSEDFADRLATAATVPELPGGGQIAFPGRRMIAAYGSPGIPSLGILGEQDLDESIERVQDLAEDYAPHSDVPVIPAFEIITTVASSQPGADGDYSSEVDAELIREWVDAAGEAGVYVVLDLQPGTTDFLTQAKLYEDLLLEPHVGLALDSEWRLDDGQRHLEQIGSVGADEINETAEWLAELTAENGLPQKVFILHQFADSMITDREDIDASHPELAMLLHADGHGDPGMKMGTWERLQEDLPDGIRMAWKNFYDEDSPTFTPEQTYDLEPRPWFVSYQ